MGWFSWFYYKEDEKLNPQKDRDDSHRKQPHLTAPSNPQKDRDDSHRKQPHLTSPSNPQKDRDDSHRKQPHLTAPSNISRLSSGADRVKTRSTNSSKREFLGIKDKPDVQIAAHTFTFRELAAATNNFRPESFIGEGEFGRVYKGQLPSGQVVAVKQLDRNGLQGNREFLAEVLMHSLLHHPNLVDLIGYCVDGDQRLLVYEFMPLGSLEDHLHEKYLSKTKLLDYPDSDILLEGETMVELQ